MALVKTESPRSTDPTSSSIQRLVQAGSSNEQEGEGETPIKQWLILPATEASI